MTVDIDEVIGWHLRWRDVACILGDRAEVARRDFYLTRLRALRDLSAPPAA